MATIAPTRPTTHLPAGRWESISSPIILASWMSVLDLGRRVDGGSVVVDRFPHWSHCYGCGRTNPSSQGVVLEYEEDGGVLARVHIDLDHGGAPGFAHGGYLSFLLDEVMGGVGGDSQPRVTTDMTVRFLKAVPLDSDVVVAGRVERREERGFRVKGAVTIAGAASPSVEATAYFRFVNLERLRRRR